MAHPLRKMASFLGLVEDDGIQMEESMETTEVEFTRPIPHRLNRNETPSYLRSEEPRSSSVRTTSAQVRPLTSSVSTFPTESTSVRPARAASISDIVSLTPRVYSDAKLIGEHYRNGQTVVMNLTDMDDEERRRLVDFAAGLVFGHQGSIERVTSKVFLLTPPSVSVSNEDKQAAAHNFFNQS
jgi:cell division inhibitor SepF